MNNSNLLRLSLLLLLLSPLGYAEIVTDGSLGAATSLTGPNVAIGADLGQRRGGNLFHSFSQFDIANGESATFSGPTEIANVISRVTGGQPSTIDGLLRADIAGANLFLLNPAGVLFGPNASVDIGGSLHVSTGDYLLMDDNDMTRFLATSLQGEVLSTAAPAAFGFLDSSPGAIQLQGAQLTLASKRILSLTAANIAVEQSTVTIDQGEILISAIKHAGEVPIDSAQLDASVIPTAGTITVDRSVINVDGAGGGYIAVRGQQLAVQDSMLSSLTIGNDNGREIAIVASGSTTLVDSSILASADGPGAAGAVTVVVGERLELTGDSIIGSDSNSLATGSGNAGTVTIDATEVIVTNDAKISSDTYGSGNAGAITVNTKRLELSGDWGIFSDSNYSATGDAGAITVDATEVIVTNGAFISSDTYASGNAGTVNVKNAERLELSGDQGIFSNSYSIADAGDAGTVTIDATEVIVTNDAKISSDTHGSGNAGAITVNTKRLELSGDWGIFSDSNYSATGDAGAITVDATELIVTNGAFISSDTYGSGNAGAITVKNAERLELSGDRGIFSDSYASIADAGDAGTVTVDASNVLMTNGAKISSITFGPGNAGKVDIKVDTLLLDSGKFTSESLGTGIAGKVTLSATESVYLLNGATVSTETIDGFDADNPASIELSARDLLLDSGSSITTNAGGAADAGNIKLAVDKAIQLLGDSRVSTESAGGGGGGVNIMVNDLLYLQDGKITTNVGLGGGNGGDIFVDPTFIVLDNSVISANAVDGNGGNITLIADYIQRSTDSAITASSQLGIDGEINIEALDADVNTGEDNLSADFLDASQWQRQACSQRSGADVSSFVIEQRPLRPAPHDDWSVSRELL